MIFFDNCCPILWAGQYLSIGRGLKLRFRPPRSYPILLSCIVFLLLSSSKGYAKQITLSLKSVPLETAFEEIKKQSGFGFWYEKRDLEGLAKVTVAVTGAGLKQALDLCLKGQPLSYEIFDKTVVVKRKAVLPVAVPVKRALQEKVRGKVVDAQSKEPLAGVLVKVLAPVVSVVTDDKGVFELNLPNGRYELVVQYMGYGARDLVVAVPLTGELVVSLIAGEQTLEEVKFVSTGYQSLPKERATGSFTTVDNNLLNRTVTTNIIDRLDGVTSGMIFPVGSNLTRNSSRIEIRGRSTLFSNAEPLVIVDNFPYDGDLANINPNDVEDVTILKDAAAASVWGARAGNGVIVITTKKGKIGAATSVGFSSSINVSGKPNIYSRPQLSSAEYIDVEEYLFEKGAYNSIINNGYGALSPAVEIFLSERNGNIGQEEKRSRLDALRGIDVRDQLSKYYYRKQINQQYLLNIKGGTSNQKYYFSLGRDDNRGSEINNNYDRLTLNANHTYFLLNKKLELNTALVFTGSNSSSGLGEGGLPYPYTQVADTEGNAVAVPNILREAYIKSVSQGKLLDWTYRPLEEWTNGYGKSKTNQVDYRLNLALKYDFFKGLSATASFGYQNGRSGTNRLNELTSFFTRNLINQYTQINSTTGAVLNPLPMGGILSSNDSEIESINGRLQLNYSKQWDRDAIDLVAGSEIREFGRANSSEIFYGYNAETLTNQNATINTTVNFPHLYGTGTSRIVISPTSQTLDNRFLSYYFSGSYTFNGTYILSLSGRKDESNIFGVTANLKGVPLWSAGFAWKIDKESFFRWNAISQLKLRSTFGYTGNVNNALSAMLTSVAAGSQMYNAINARIENFPNPSLRWEKNRTINLGIDFAFKNNRLSGSIDLWHKKGFDLIGNSPIAPQTGIAMYMGNSANTLTKGVDLEINSLNLNGRIRWNTTLLYNHTVNKVISYKVSNGNNFNVVSGNYNNPLEGYPYFSVFSFRYYGLDNLGNPLASLNGNSSIDYAGIRNTSDRNDLIYHGSATPTHFGSLRNTFVYEGFDLSFNVVYKFGYYFRRNSLDNGSLYSTAGNYKMPDYERRWQKPGDEHSTDVPSLIYPSNTARTSIYTYSQALVEKGDHLRLRDIRLGYSFADRKKSPFRVLNVFTSINDLGVLWRANNQGVDPDFINGITPPRTIILGLRGEF